jgi:sodium-dependent phosphate cotransporter
VALQSSGAATSLLMALNASGLFESSLFVYMILGTRIGTSITLMIASFIIFSKKRRDFRHGFEIALANLIYALPIAILMFFLEYNFSLFSKLGGYFMLIPYEKFSLVTLITRPVLNLFSIFPKFFILILGFLFLFISLTILPKILISLWNKKTITKKLNKYMGKKYSAFLIGFGLTAVLLSTTITLTLLVPLIILRLINLKKVIPYIIGANLGGVIDVIIGSIVIGKNAFSALFIYVLFSIIGLIWLFNTNIIFNLTKYVSKRVIKVSKKRALLFLILFILIAFLLLIV